MRDHPYDVCRHRQQPLGIDRSPRRSGPDNKKGKVLHRWYALRRSAFAAVVALGVCFQAYAVEWADFATVSQTLGINDNRLCVGDSSKGDIGCPTYAPTVSSAGLLTATNISVTALTVNGVEITGSASGDRITSGTTSLIAHEDTDYISITTAGTTTGYITPAGLFVLSGISATTNRTSVTTLYASGQITAANIISTTAIQLASDTTACSSGTAGRLSYVSGNLYVCNGTAWTTVGGGGASIPTGTVAAFNLASCPSGWSEVTDARGRMLIGVGTLGAATYTLGGTGGYAYVTLTTTEMPSHNHTATTTITRSNSNYDVVGHTGIFGMGQAVANEGSGAVTTLTLTAATTVNNNGSGAAHENRPPYLGMLFCEYTGSGGGGGGGEGGVSMLVSLTDVTISNPTNGQVLTYNGSAWVNDDAAGGSGDWYGIASIPAQIQAVSNSGNITLGTLTATTASATTMTAETLKLSESSASCSGASDHGKLRRDPTSKKLQICLDR